MSKEHPILFSGEMVRAIIEGRKTMTRRIMKYRRAEEHKEKGFPGEVQDNPSMWAPSSDVRPASHAEGLVYEDEESGRCFIDFQSKEIDGSHWTACIRFPFGKPGDILWVRESYRVNAWLHEEAEVNFTFNAGPEYVTPYVLFDDWEKFERLWVQSCDDLDKAGVVIDEKEERYIDYDVKHLRLRPAIHMFKEIARIWLQVVSVRAEKLQDISWDDAVAEGFSGYRPTQTEPTHEFKRAWNELNGNWEKNPWVWVIEFKVLSTTGKPQI